MAVYEILFFCSKIIFQWLFEKLSPTSFCNMKYASSIHTIAVCFLIMKLSLFPYPSLHPKNFGLISVEEHLRTRFCIFIHSFFLLWTLILINSHLWELKSIVCSKKPNFYIFTQKKKVFQLKNYGFSCSWEGEPCYKKKENLNWKRLKNFWMWKKIFKCN